MLIKLNYGKTILKGLQIIVCTRAPRNLVATLCSEVTIYLEVQNNNI
jgi:hypothetical protein